MARTPGYDRSTVVTQAMSVFWERGYGRTSIGDLVNATGLKPGSLYAAFGSKKGVFLEVLDEYNRGFLARIRRLSLSTRPAIVELEGLLAAIVEETLAGRDHRGCLSVNALLEMSRHEPDVADRIETHNRNVRKAFAELLARAQVEGDIDADRDTAALSAFLVNNIWGMRVMCRGKPERATLTATVDGVMASLRSWPGFVTDLTREAETDAGS